MSFQAPEAEYRAFKYEPDFDSLPWKESYNAASTTVGLQKPAN
jgi:surface antigen